MTDVPTVPTERTRLGVVGWPVAHSRSPAMHNAALADVGLSQWRYSLLPVPPELVAETLRALPAAGFRGVNVTIPHKAAALAVADTATARARVIGAANTLVYDNVGIAADNTDAPALITTLAALGSRPVRSALVLGAGGSARAAVWALRDAGVADLRVWNRTPERAHALAAQLGARAVTQPAPADVLVNCTSLGLDGGDPFRDPGGFPFGAASISAATGSSSTTSMPAAGQAGAVSSKPPATARWRRSMAWSCWSPRARSASSSSPGTVPRTR